MALELTLGESKTKLLVTGATGWFGKQALDLGLRAGMEVMACGSKKSEVKIRRRTIPVKEFELDAIKTFSPTLVVDAAFITRERMAALGTNLYIAQNRELIDKSTQLVQLETVDTYIGFSSGATKHLAGMKDFSIENNPYSYLKREYELEFERLSATLDKKISIARVWSVSGPFCPKPATFALTNFIEQAKQGRISIESANRVFRRYAPIELVLLLSVKFAKSRGANIFDTGGPLVELGDLAKTVLDVVNPMASIKRPELIEGFDDNYFSNAKAWGAMLAQLKLEQPSIRQQVELSFFETN